MVVQGSQREAMITVNEAQPGRPDPEAVAFIGRRESRSAQEGHGRQG